MSRFVVEPCVVIKWFIPEIDSGSAARLLDGGHELLGADTLVQGVGGLVALKASLGELTPEEALEVLGAVMTAPVRVCATQPILGPAMEMSMTMGRPLSDGIDLALAVQNECRLVTARRPLYEAITGSVFARHVKWVGEVR